MPSERMQVTIHRPGGQQARYRARIEEVAGQAARLVAQETGGSMPDVRIVLTDSAGIVKLKERADHEIASGGSRRPSLGFWDSMATAIQSSALGQTVLDRTGTLLIINGPKVRNLDDLDDTLVHELVHCIQLNEPTTHRRQIAFIRQLYGVEPRTRDFHAYLRVVDDQEIEASRLERLARKLPSPRT